jgi:hypothetical protein
MPELAVVATAVSARLWLLLLEAPTMDVELDRKITQRRLQNRVTLANMSLGRGWWRHDAVAGS